MAWEVTGPVEKQLVWFYEVCDVPVELPSKIVSLHPPVIGLKTQRLVGS